MVRRPKHEGVYRVGLLAGGAVLVLASVAAIMVVGSLAATGAQDQKGAAPLTAPAQKSAPPQQAPQQAVPGWAVQCTNPGQGLTCKATQTMMFGKTRQLLLSVSVSKPEGKAKNATMLLHVGHGLFLPAGVTLAIDGGKPETLPVQTCNAKGCYAGTPLTPVKLTAMTAGAKLNVTFQNLAKKKIVVPMPLKGFTEAYKKL